MAIYRDPFDVGPTDSYTSPTPRPTGGGAVPRPISSYPGWNSGLSDAYAQLQGAYKEYLGREGSDAEILSHLSGGSVWDATHVSQAASNIASSSEAQAYRNRPVSSTSAPVEPTPAPTPAPVVANPSPVTETGGIPTFVPQTTPAQAAPAPAAPTTPATAPAPAATGAIPSPGPGWVQIPGGGWVPPDHPLAATAGAQATTPGAAAGSALTGPYAPPPRPAGTEYTPTPITGTLPTYTPQTFAGSLPGYTPTTFSGALPSYTATNISPFTAPDQAATNASESALLQQILANPQTLTPQVVSQLMEQQKETAVTGRQQAMDRLWSDAAARGTLPGGYTQASARRVEDATLRDILGGQRDISIRAAEQNRADQIAALAAAESVQTGQATRATSLYDALLSGQQAQAKEGQFAYGAGVDAATFAQKLAEANVKERQYGYTTGVDAAKFANDLALQNAKEQQWGFASQADAAQFKLKTDLANEAAKQTAAQQALASYGEDIGAWSTGLGAQQSANMLALQKALGEGGLAVDWGRISEGGRQFNLGNQLNWAQLLQMIANQTDASKYNWANLQASNTNPFYSSLFGV